MKTFPLTILTILLAAGCLRQPGRAGKDQSAVTGNSHATRFSIDRIGDYSLLRVVDPWQGSSRVIYSYLLGNDKSGVPDSLSSLPFITTPVRRVITLSTTHVAMLSHLGRAGSIVGASGTGFIYDPEIRKRIDAGDIREIGYGQGLNYETVVDLDPDVLFIYGVEGNVTTTTGKLEEMGIPVVYCAEYLETHPLGKAEWIRFFASFFGLDREANALFAEVDSTYKTLTGLTADVTERPEVLTGLPWKDTWYMAGGQSYAARLITDAGGDYLWKEDPSDEAIPLDLESVFSRAVEADIWINPGAANSLIELRQFDNRLSELPLYGPGTIFNNNSRMGEGGGNDYWESGTVRPDQVLADLISLFHPKLLPDHTLFYYRQLN